MSARALRSLLGHWRLTPLAVAAYAGTSFIGVVIALGGRVEPGRSVALLAALVTAAASLALLLLATVLDSPWIVGRIREPGRFAITAIGTGLLRAVVLQLAASALVGESLLNPAAVYVSSVVSAVIWLGFAGLLAAGKDQYRRRYRDLLAGQAFAGESWDRGLDGHPDVMRLKAAIADSLAVEGEDGIREGLVRAASAIRIEIEENLRPLSHRLWFGSLGEEPHVRWRNVVRDALCSYSVPVRVVTAMWAAGSLVGGVALWGAVPGLVAAGASTLALGILLRLGTPTVPRTGSAMVGGIAALATAGLSILAARSSMAALGLDAAADGNLLLTSLIALALLGLILAGASIALAYRDREEVLRVAAGGLDAGEARAVSVYLHNGLQSELTGIALEMEAAVGSSDPEQARAVIERAEAVLSRSLEDDLAQMHRAPVERLERLAAAWAGICAVSTGVDPGLDGDRRMWPAVQAAEELVANAVRHSGATEVDVRIVAGADRVCVECRANVPGSVARGTGLGGSLLDDIAEGGIEVTREGTGTLYRLGIG